MILQSLKLKDVKCFEDIEIEFVPGKNVILGHNGAGKSTILQSILYALYGQYPQGQNKNLVRRNESAAEFDLKFMHEGREYQIERKLTQSGAQAFLTDVKGTDLLAETQKGVTEAVTETTQTRMEVFRDVVLVRQGEIAEIIDMRSSERKVLFDKLLGIHEYEEAWNRCADLKKVLENKVNESDRIISIHKPTADLLEERKEKLVVYEGELKKKRKLYRKARGIMKDVNSRWKILDGIKLRIDRLITAIEGSTERLDRDKESASTQRVEVQALCNKLNVTLPARLLTLLTRSKKQHESSKARIKTMRKQLMDLRGKNQRLTTNIERRNILQSEADMLEETIQTSKDNVLEYFPKLARSPYAEWEASIKKEVLEHKTRKGQIRRSLNTAITLQGNVAEQATIIKGFKDSISTLEKNITENDRKAESEGGKNWREIASRNLQKVTKQLGEVFLEREHAEKALSDIDKEVNRAAAKVNKFEEELADLTGLIGKKCPRCKQLVDDEHAETLRGKTESDLKSAKEGLKSLNRNQKTAKMQFNNLKRKEEELRSDIQITEKLEIYLEAEKKTQSEIKRIEPKLTRAEEKIDALQIKLSRIDVKSLEDEDEELEEQIETFQDLIREAKLILRTTPKKDQMVLESGDLDKKIAGLQALLLDDKIPEMVSKIDSMEEKTDDLSQLVSKTDELMRLDAQVKKTGKNVKVNVKELRGLKSDFDPKEFQKLTKRRDEVQKEESSFETRIETLTTELIPTTQGQFDESKTANDAIDELRDEYERATKALEALSKVREFYREVQKPLRRRDIGRASAHATEVFKSLMGTHEYDRIRITEDHDLQISRFGELEPMSDLSGGEQVIAGLSVRLGFARALANSDLLILDEPTAFLDDTRKAELVQTLQYASPVKQMLIVTHDDEFQCVAQKVIRVQKDDATLVSNASIQE